MKVGILTHPLRTNYGGILQAYALLGAIRKLCPAADVCVINRSANDTKLKKVLRKILILFGLRHKSNSTEKNPQNQFICKYINRTKKVDNTILLKRLIKKEQLNFVVFGSDQIWRADFNRSFNFDYWGCFLKNLTKVKGFSYAASISEDKWNYDENETKKIKSGVSLLKGISVREFDAVELCKSNLGISAKLIIDPTLLHESGFYDKIESGKKRKPFIFVYWLGDQSEISDKIENLKEKFDIVTVSLRNKNTFVTVADWINLIKNAETVFTDSFHGMVFSILYHKHFVISKNISGGVNRLKTLFSIIGYPQKLEHPEMYINYDLVEKRLISLRKEGYNYLSESLDIR